MTTGPFEAAGALPLRVLYFRNHMDVLLCCSLSLSFLILKCVCCCGTRVTLWLVLRYPGVNSFRGGQTNKQTTKLIFKTFDMAVTPVAHNNRQKCLHSELSSECSFYLFFFTSVITIFWVPFFVLLCTEYVFYICILSTYVCQYLVYIDFFKILYKLSQFVLPTHTLLILGPALLSFFFFN